ncbi:MAG: EF-hand domain-containing protein [bacterium]|nr:EF-hand domain-containing protein [bacterium]
MKKLWFPAVLVALTGCGSLPTFPAATGDQASTEQSTATSSLYRILGLEEPTSEGPADVTEQPTVDQPALDQPAPVAPGATPSAEPGRAPAGHDLLFLLLDADGNGKIESAELKSAIQSRKADVSDQAIAELFQKLDRNADGAIESAELAPPRGRGARGRKMRGGEGRGRAGGHPDGRRPMGPPPHGHGHHHGGRDLQGAPGDSPSSEPPTFEG